MLYLTLSIWPDITMLYLILTYDTSICLATFDPWYLTPVFDTDIFHAIFDTDSCHDICDMWPWYWYLPYYIWHVISDPDICLATLITWHWTPILDTWRLFLTHSTYYAGHLIFDMLYLPHDILHWYLTCYTCHMTYYTGIWHTMLATWYLTCHACHLIYITPILTMIFMTPDTWHLTPDSCITWHMHDYYYQRSGSPVLLYFLYLLYSCIPVLLYSYTHALVNSTVKPASGRTCLVSGWRGCIPQSC